MSRQSHHTPLSQTDFKEQHRCLWHWMQNRTGCREPQHQGTQRKHRASWCKAERPAGGLSIFQKRHIAENIKGGR